MGLPSCRLTVGATGVGCDVCKTAVKGGGPGGLNPGFSDFAMRSPCRLDLSAGMRIMNWMDERELEKVAGEASLGFSASVTWPWINIMVIGVPSSVGLFLTFTFSK